MNYRFLGKISYHSAILLACVTLSCRPQQAVILSPGESDLVVLNGCVISACNYLAVVKTQHALDKSFWAKILLVRYTDHPAGHAYCVWETDGTIYGYDRNAGSFPIPVYVRDPRAIAIVLAQELGKVMNENLSVDKAEFVESQQAQLYKFESLQSVAIFWRLPTQEFCSEKIRTGPSNCVAICRCTPATATALARSARWPLPRANEITNTSQSRIIRKV